jgi:O-methyltransferase involved in polyketide biosynthesis
MLPLWARARETEKDNPIVCDTYAKNIVERIDYDFSQIEKGPVADHQSVWAIRAYNFDNILEVFLANNSRAVVVNIGAGLDTTFQRVGEGTVLWINIDLPDVVALRQKLIPDSDREMTIAKSVFDFTWIDEAVPFCSWLPEYYATSKPRRSKSCSVNLPKLILHPMLSLIRCHGLQRGGRTGKS